MDLTLKSEYWDDPVARQAFKDFMVEIHGLDFTAWESAGFWDTAFTPFSLFDGDHVVASTCIYLLDAVIDERKTKLAQISSVGTLPERRRQGLNRTLTEDALLWAHGKHDGVFLFSDEDAGPFYTKCGFDPTEEFLEVMELEPVRGKAGALKLDPASQKDLRTIYDYAKGRTHISNRLSVQNPRLLMFHVLYFLRDAVYMVPECECLVFLRRSEGRLDVYDVVGEHIPLWSALYPFLAHDQDETVRFHFYTDRLGLDGTRPEQIHGNYPFVKGRFPVSNPVFPYTCRA